LNYFFGRNFKFICILFIGMRGIVFKQNRSCFTQPCSLPYKECKLNEIFHKDFEYMNNNNGLFLKHIARTSFLNSVFACSQIKSKGTIGKMQKLSLAILLTIAVVCVYSLKKVSALALTSLVLDKPRASTSFTIKRTGLAIIAKEVLKQH